MPYGIFESNRSKWCLKNAHVSGREPIVPMCMHVTLAYLSWPVRAKTVTPENGLDSSKSSPFRLTRLLFLISSAFLLCHFNRREVRKLKFMHYTKIEIYI